MRARSGAVPTTGATSIWGANFWNSAAQLYTRDDGHTTRLVPLPRFASRKDIICTDLPRPISSARMPPKPMAASALSHWKPARWYGRSWAATDAGGSKRLGSTERNPSTYARNDSSFCSSVMMLSSRNAL